MAGMIYRPLGRTGEKVSAIGLGGYHIGKQEDENESIRIIRAAVENGITFMDNSWDYHGGQSEVRMGKALRDGYRQKVFLMTKIDGRTRKAAATQLAQSLERLQVDYVDLIQIHEVIRITDAENVFEEGGAIEAVLEARRSGQVRFIGFTGHKDPLMHLRMLDAAAQHHFRFDTVQMPLNVFDAHFRSFEHEVLPILVREQIGVIGMKPMGSGSLLQTDSGISPIECLHYAMNLSTSTVVTGIESMELLQQALRAVSTFKPFAPVDVSRLLSRTAPAAESGRYELYKTSDDHDGTSRNPQWLGLATGVP